MDATRDIGTRERVIGNTPLALGALVGLGVTYMMAARVSQADFLVFYKAATAIVRGNNPYPALGSPAVYDGSSYVYPIWVAALLSPLTIFGATVAAKIWVALSFGAYAASLRLMGKPSPAALLFATLSTPVIISMQMGTLAPFLVLGIAIAWRWRDSPVISALAIALAGTSKLYLLAGIAFFAATRRTRALILSVVFSLALLGAGFAFGPLGAAGYVKLLLSLSAHESVRGWSLSAILTPLAGVGMARLVAQVASIAALIALVATRRRLPQDARALGGAVAISLLATPILWSSYLPLLLAVLLLAEAPTWVLAGAAGFTWLLVTPDLARAPLDAVGIVVLVLVAVAGLALTGGAKVRETALETWHSTRLRVLGLYPRSKAAFAASVLIGAAEVLVLLVRPGLLPALVTQDLVLLALAYSLSGSQPAPGGTPIRGRAPLTPA